MNFHVPFILLLLLFYAKEWIPNDSEKIVISCILSFILLTYYLTKNSISEIFDQNAIKLEEEFQNFLELKRKLEKKVKSFWYVFLDLEYRLIKLSRWCKNLARKIAIITNTNRILFCVHIIKDYLNTFSKENTIINFNSNLVDSNNNSKSLETITSSVLLKILDQVKEIKSESKNLITNNFNSLFDLYYLDEDQFISE